MEKNNQPGFLRSVNIYEVNIRQYTPEGNFNSFAKHLPRLHDMGVKVLWLMPIHPIGVINRKGSLGSYYSIKDHCAVNPEFGTDEDLKALIAKAHGLGMLIILDWVANHAAWDNVWTVTHPEYFVRDEAGNFKPPYDWTDVIQVDHSNVQQQAAMTEAMKFWITNFDIDGFRADLAHLTPLDFWKKARNETDALKPGLVWLAETEDPAYHEAFDISFAWKWMHITEKIKGGACNAADLQVLFEQAKAELPQDALQLFFSSNHDENSWNGTEFEKYGLFAKALAVFSFTCDEGVPLIYSGQEIPNTKRLRFFEKDTIEWPVEPELHGFYKQLCGFRSSSELFGSEAGLATGFIPSAVERNMLGYYRKGGRSSMIVLINMNMSTVMYEPGIEPGTSYKDLFTGLVVGEGGETTVELSAGGFVLLEQC